MLGLIILIVALVFGIISLVQTRATSLLAWAVVLTDVALLLPRIVTLN